MFCRNVVNNRSHWLCLKNQLATFRALGFIHTWLQPGAAKGEISPETV
jgi:hypothetical protein